jgi:hypothetical protein
MNYFLHILDLGPWALYSNSHSKKKKKGKKKKKPCTITHWGAFGSRGLVGGIEANLNSAV